MAARSLRKNDDGSRVGDWGREGEIIRRTSGDGAIVRDTSDGPPLLRFIYERIFFVNICLNIDYIMEKHSLSLCKYPLTLIRKVHN